MPRTREQLEQASADAEAWLDSIDPETTPLEDTSDLRAVAEAQDAVAAALRHLETTVVAARVGGRSWGAIGLALGMSRQAAQERFNKAPKVAGASASVRPKGARVRVSTAARVAIVEGGKVPTRTAATSVVARGSKAATKKVRAKAQPPEKG